MKCMLRSVQDGDTQYECLMFACPGCAEDGGSGLHMLPVNTTETSPAWHWDGNIDAPTLTPSILTRTNRNGEQICHSYLKNGTFEFLDDCTHSFKGQNGVEMLDLPDWIVHADD